MGVYLKSRAGNLGGPFHEDQLGEPPVSRPPVFVPNELARAKCVRNSQHFVGASTASPPSGSARPVSYTAAMRVDVSAEVISNTPLSSSYNVLALSAPS